MLSSNSVVYVRFRVVKFFPQNKNPLTQVKISVRGRMNNLNSFRATIDTVLRLTLIQSCIRLPKTVYVIRHNLRSISVNPRGSKNVGGTAWESNPPDLAHGSQAVLKTVYGTSGQISYKFPRNIKGSRQSLVSFLDHYPSTSTVSILE